MNSNTQAQKGFKTFILTLVISLAVFSAIYYVINSGADNSSSTVSYLDETPVVESETTAADSATLGDSSTRKLATNTSSDEPKSVFQELATSNMNLEDSRQVLAEETADTTTTTTTTTTTATTAETAAEVPESTVPVTGLSSPTYGILFSAIALAIFAYIMFIGPRKLALNSFEKDVLDDLD